MNAKSATRLLGLRWADLQDLKKPGGQPVVAARLRKRYQFYAGLAVLFLVFVLVSPYGSGPSYNKIVSGGLFLAFNAFRWWEADNLLAIASPGPGPSTSPTDTGEP